MRNRSNRQRRNIESYHHATTAPPILVAIFQLSSVVDDVYEIFANFLTQVSKIRFNL